MRRLLVRTAVRPSKKFSLQSTAENWQWLVEEFLEVLEVLKVKATIVKVVMNEWYRDRHVEKDGLPVSELKFIKIM